MSIVYFVTNQAEIIEKFKPKETPQIGRLVAWNFPLLKHTYASPFEREPSFYETPRAIYIEGEVIAKSTLLDHTEIFLAIAPPSLERRQLSKYEQIKFTKLLADITVIHNEAIDKHSL